jgi:hypothetical protein
LKIVVVLKISMELIIVKGSLVCDWLVRQAGIMISRATAYSNRRKGRLRILLLPDPVFNRKQDTCATCQKPHQMKNVTRMIHASLIVSRSAPDKQPAIESTSA